MNYDDRELLARTLQAEAGGEGYLGLLAAGAVIDNRVNSGAYGGTYRGNILAPGQFSAWNGVTGYAGGEGALDMHNIRPTEDAYRAADAILSGSYEDPTGGALNYYNPDVANPNWGASAGGQWTPIGNHVFGTAGGLPSAAPDLSFAGLPPAQSQGYAPPGFWPSQDEPEEEPEAPYGVFGALFGPRTEEGRAYQQGLDAHGQGLFARGDDGSLNVFGRTLDQDQRRPFAAGLMRLGAGLTGMVY